MKVEERYFVLKWTDIIGAELTVEESKVIEDVAKKVNKYRYKRSAPVFECLVIEKDWPEYEPTLKLLSERVDAEEKESK